MRERLSQLFGTESERREEKRERKTRIRWIEERVPGWDFGFPPVEVHDEGPYTTVAKSVRLL